MTVERVAPLLDLITAAEARGNHDVFYGFEHAAKPATDMTLDEVRAHQTAMLTRGSVSSAAGAYQILRPTLDGLRRNMGLAGNALFTRALQDRMAVELLRGRGLDRYLSGETTLPEFANALSQEWASFPNFTGRGKGGRTLPPECSYYDGDGINRASVSCAEVEAVLRKIMEPPMQSGIVDKFLGFLPGTKTYLVGLAMIATGLAQMIEAHEQGALFGPTFMQGWDQFLEGAGLVTVRRGIKTDMVQRLVAPAPPASVQFRAGRRSGTKGVAPCGAEPSYLRRQLMDNFAKFQAATEQAQRALFAEAVREEAQQLAGVAPPQVSASTSSIMAIEQFPGDGTSYSSLHFPDRVRHPDVALTAFHADIPHVRAALEDMLGLKCFLVERAEEDTRHFLDGNTPDAHVFAKTREAAEAFKADCPDPGFVSQAMGFTSPSMWNEDTALAPTVVARGYPAGYDDGPPQTRLLVPYLVQNPTSTSGLHTFYSKRASDPRQFGIMIGGNSGGEARVLGGDHDGAYCGVIVRRGFVRETAAHLAVVQPIHNKIVLV